MGKSSKKNKENAVPNKKAARKQEKIEKQRNADLAKEAAKKKRELLRAAERELAARQERLTKAAFAAEGEEAAASSSAGTSSSKPSSPAGSDDVPRAEPLDLRSEAEASTEEVSAAAPAPEVIDPYVREFVAAIFAKVLQEEEKAAAAAAPVKPSKEGWGWGALRAVCRAAATAATVVVTAFKAVCTFFCRRRG